MWPAIFSRSQTPELRLEEKVVQDDHFETDPPANMPRELVHVAGSLRHVFSHPGSPPSQTILEIRIRRGGISIQVPAVWAIPGSPHFNMMHGCSSFPSATGGNLHTQLPRRLAHSGPVAGGFNIAQDPPSQPLRLPMAQGQLCQEHSVTQPTVFVPGYSYRLSTDDSNCLSGASHDNSVPSSILHGRYHPSVQIIPENAGPFGSGFGGTSVGSASHATHPVLAEAEGSIHSLASWTPPRKCDSGLCISPGPLEGPLLAKARHDPRHSAQKEGCLDRHLQQELGSAVRGQTDLRPTVQRGVGPAHQLPINSSSVLGLSILPVGHSGTPRANRLRQQICGVIHKSPGRPRLEATLHTGEQLSAGSEQSALTEGDTWAGQNESRSRHVVKDQCLLRGMDAPLAPSSENLGNLW